MVPEWYLRRLHWLCCHHFLGPCNSDICPLAGWRGLCWWQAASLLLISSRRLCQRTRQRELARSGWIGTCQIRILQGTWNTCYSWRYENNQNDFGELSTWTSPIDQNDGHTAPGIESKSSMAWLLLWADAPDDEPCQTMQSSASSRAHSF